MKVLKKEPAKLAQPASKRARPELSQKQIAFYGGVSKSQGFSIYDAHRFFFESKTSVSH
jgi:hypothetical protein